jgi:ATP-dependent DNA helicase PIF1
MSLNEDQQRALAAVLEGHNIFLTGPGGTGKSFLIRRILDTLNEQNKKAAVTALTGCAALLLGKDAKTIHSWAGIGLGREPASKVASDIRKLPYKAKVLRRWLTTKVLIIDEISMMTPALLELLNDVAKLVRRDDRLFGGIQLVLVGDFFQLPPVYKQEEGRPEQSFVFESPLWEQLSLKVCMLNQQMRQQDDPTFQEILHEARYGLLSAKSMDVLERRQNLPWQDLEIRPTLLFSRRAEVEVVNERNLSALPGPKHIFKAKTVFSATNEKKLTEASPEVKFAIAKLDRDAPYKVELELREGAQVMLLYNLDIEAGLVNGSRGVVKGFTATSPPLPKVLFKGHSEPIEIGVQTWECEDLEGVKRSQIPLILAYAVTIHKCQGATLDSALIDIGPRTFEVGQAYVALSRVKNLESLYIYDLDPLAFKTHTRVKDFYQELTSMAIK